jgi:hypothetical protein
MEDGSQTDGGKLFQPILFVDVSPFSVPEVAEQLAGPVVMVRGDADAGKSAVLVSLFKKLDTAYSARSLRRSIASAGQLYALMSPPGDLIRTSDLVTFDVVPAQSTTSIAWFADTEDRPWSFMVGPLSPDQIISSDAARHVKSSSLTIDEYILDRQVFLRLVDRIRIALRIRLIRVLNGLSRIPDAINLILLLLAASRCYGHRTEPSDYALPVLTSMSVVIGETARLC